MKDNEDKQVNDTHINTCFNQTISQLLWEFTFSIGSVQTRFYWCSLDYVDPTQFYTLNVCLNWLIFCSKQELKCTLSPAWIPQRWQCADCAHRSSPCPGQARAREEVILSLVLSLLSFLSNVTWTTTNVASNFLCVLLLHVVVAKDLQQLFCSRDPILELAKAHAGKANAWVPPNRASCGGVWFLCETLWPGET